MEMTIVRVVLLARLEMKDIYGSTSKIDPEAVVWVAEFLESECRQGYSRIIHDEFVE
jgi:hypothetical protein